MPEKRIFNQPIQVNGTFRATGTATFDGSVVPGSVAATGAVSGTSVSTTGNVTAGSATAVAAGGSTSGAFLMSSTAALGVYVGSGAPTISAAQGSLYLRTDGSSVSTRLYVNTNGTTGWTNVTTAT